MKAKSPFRALRPVALAFVLLSMIDPGRAGEVFYESFDQCNGTGGNDGSWSGSIASAILTATKAGWTFENGYGAKQCAKFGTGSKLGSATTPALGTAGTLTLTFKAAAWNGGSEKTTIGLSVAEGGGTLDTSTITLVKGQWSDYTAVISDATAATKIMFAAKDASNNRFFLDEVRVTQDGGDDPDPPQPTAPTISVAATTTTVEVYHAVTATITTNSAVTSVTASVGDISGNTWSWTPNATGTTTVTFTASGAAGTTPATATLTVNVTTATLSAPTIAAADTLLSDGTGFTAHWSAVSAASSYEIQVATNALFDAVRTVIFEEHFDDLTSNFYDSDKYGDAKRAYALKNVGESYTTPSFVGGGSFLTFSAAPAVSSATGSVLTIQGIRSTGGTDDPTTVIIDSGSKKTYSVALSGNATQVRFSLTTKVTSGNVGIDDVRVYGPVQSTVVVHTSASGSSTTLKAITGLSPHTLYYIRVRAVNGGQKSDWSATTSVTTAAGNTNFAPEIPSFSPTTATVAVGSTQVFSIGYSDVNSGDTLTLAVTDNGNQLTSATLPGVSGTFSYTYTAATPGTHALAFTLSDNGSLSAVTNATVTVPVPVPTLSAIDETTLLDDGTGFSVAWSAVPVATGYTLQIATNALFDVGRNIVLEEHFDTLTNGIPHGWDSSKESGYYYFAAANHYGISQPSYKFDTNNQTLTTPEVSSPVWAVGFTTYGQSGGVSTLTISGLQNGNTSSQVAIQPAETTLVEQFVEFSSAADQVRFVFTKNKNLSLDDVVLYGAAQDSIVLTTNVAASATSVDLVGLVPNTTYYVRICALYNGDSSDWSTVVSATTPTGGANFPPELSVTPASADIAGGASASFTVTYSDPNVNDVLALAVAIDGTAATSLNIASGGTYTYTPSVAGAHRLVFSVTDGTYTTYSTNDVTVTLATPVIGDITNPTTAPYGFRVNWTGVALNDGYEVEVATDPLFDAAPGAIVFSEDFTTLSDTTLPTAWSASADKEFRYTSSQRCGERSPAFRFGTSGDTLQSPTFPVGGTHLAFFAYSTKGPQALYAIGNTANGEETKTVTIAEGRGNYETTFSSAVTGVRFEFSQTTAGGYVGLDDIVVRTAKTVNSLVTPRVRTAADATSNAFTGLAGAVSYYVRVRAVSDNAESAWSDTAEVPFLAAPTNLVFHHGKYIEDGSSLSWNAAIGAATYNVKVLEANIVTNVPIVEEFFDLGATAPKGWTFTGTIETSGDGYCGESAPALKLKNGASVTTPTLEYPAQSVSLIVSGTGNTGGSLSLYALVSNDWQKAGTIVSPGDKKPTLYPIPLPKDTSKVKIVFDNYVSGTNFAVDDFIVWGTGPVWHDYNTFTNLTTTTLPLPGLRHDTPYIFTVSSVNEFGEMAADPYKVTSPPTNPGTILKFR